MNPYQVLGVSQTADEDTIKKAYRKAAKECHPDTHPGDKRAEERFKEIGEAYRILSDKQKREEYNARAAQKEQKSAAEGTALGHAGTVLGRAERIPEEERLIREILKRNLNDFFPWESRVRKRRIARNKRLIPWM